MYDIYNKKYNKYGFKVVSVNTDNSRTFSRVKPFVNSQKYSFKVLSENFIPVAEGVTSKEKK